MDLVALRLFAAHQHGPTAPIINRMNLLEAECAARLVYHHGDDRNPQMFHVTTNFVAEARNTKVAAGCYSRTAAECGRRSRFRRGRTQPRHGSPPLTTWRKTTPAPQLLRRRFTRCLERASFGTRNFSARLRIWSVPSGTRACDDRAVGSLRLQVETILSLSAVEPPIRQASSRQGGAGHQVPELVDPDSLAPALRAGSSMLCTIPPTRHRAERRHRLRSAHPDFRRVLQCASTSASPKLFFEVRHAVDARRPSFVHRIWQQLRAHRGVR